MHEFSIAREIVDRVLEIAEERNARRVLEVIVRVTADEHLTEESLELAFRESARGTIAEDARLTVRIENPVIECDCGYEGESEDPPLCPKCGFPARLKSETGVFLERVVLDV